MFGLGPIEMFIVGSISLVTLLTPIWLVIYLRSLKRDLTELKLSVQRVEVRNDGRRRAR